MHNLNHLNHIFNLTTVYKVVRYFTLERQHMFYHFRRVEINLTLTIISLYPNLRFGKGFGILGN